MIWLLFLILYSLWSKLNFDWKMNFFIIFHIFFYVSFNITFINIRVSNRYVINDELVLDFSLIIKIILTGLNNYIYVLILKRFNYRRCRRNYVSLIIGSLHFISHSIRLICIGNLEHVILFCVGSRKKSEH